MAALVRPGIDAPRNGMAKGKRGTRPEHGGLCHGEAHCGEGMAILREERKERGQGPRYTSLYGGTYPS